MSTKGVDAGASELFQTDLQNFVKSLKATKEKPHQITHFQHLTRYFAEANSRDPLLQNLRDTTPDEQKDALEESLLKQADQMIDHKSLETKFKTKTKKVEKYINFIRTQLGEREATPANIRGVMVEIQAIYDQHIKDVLNPPKITKPAQVTPQQDVQPPENAAPTQPPPANAPVPPAKESSAPKKLTALQLPADITAFIAHALHPHAQRIFEAICHHIRYERKRSEDYKDMTKEDEARYKSDISVLVEQWNKKETERTADREARLKKRLPELTKFIAGWFAVIPKVFSDAEMEARDKIRGHKSKADGDYSLDSKEEREARIAAYNAVQGYVPRTTQIQAKAVAISIQKAQSAPDSITKQKLPQFARQPEELPHDLRVELENAGIRPITSVKRKGVLGAAVSLFSGDPYRTDFSDVMPHAHNLDPDLPAAFPLRKEKIKESLTPHFKTRAKLENDARAAKAKAEKEDKEGKAVKAPMGVDDLVSSFKKLSLKK